MGTATSEGGLAISQKEMYSYHMVSSNIHWYLPKGVVNLCPKKKEKTLHISIYSNFTHKCQYLEASKMSASSSQFCYKPKTALKKYSLSLIKAQSKIKQRFRNINR